MRGPLKEQIQNAINRAFKETVVGSNNNQAAYINVGGRRRNRKKKKAKKNNGVSGSAWSTLVFRADEPPARCLVEIPPKAKGSSPQVTKAKKACKETCKELKARLSPPRSCPKDTSAADDKPLIGNEAAEDENEALQSDQENVDPSNMPLSSLFKKSKKSKKDKKVKGKDATDTNVTDDVTGQAEAQAQELTPQQAASPPASDVIIAPPADVVTKAEQAGTENKEIGGAATMTEENDVTDEQTEKGATTAADTTNTTPTSDTSKTADMVTRELGHQDTPAVLQTSEMGGSAGLTPGEGPQLLTPSPTEGEGTSPVVDTQPPKVVDGSLPPDTAPTGREKQSLLHDHNPEGMVCCTIL